MKRALPWLLAVLAAYATFVCPPAWKAVVESRAARDYATYHYAVQAAWDGGDPYDTRQLGRLSTAEHTRKGVHPYFYPPPFLLGMLWAVPMGLVTAYRTSFWINQACVGGVFVALWRWIRPHPAFLALFLLTFTPIPDNLKMGQANLPVLLLAVLGLSWRRGELVGASAMAKMSPALYLGMWAVQRRWRPVLIACATAVVLSLLALPLVGPSAQLRFYTKVLPGFAEGSYHGLSIPIDLPANHSVPDLLNQLWPGRDSHHLSTAARRASSTINLALLAGLLWVSRKRRDPLGQALLAGAFTVVMLLIPVYTYEHHLVLLLLPLTALGAALQQRRLKGPWRPALGLAYFLLAWPLSWLRTAQEWLPHAEWWLQESKFLAMVAVGAACVVATLASPRADRGLAEPAA